MAIIQHIIFDLGGIFLNLNYAQTAAAFRQLGVANFDELFTQHHANPLFAKLETGEVTEEEFYQQIRTITTLPLTDTQIAVAWNAMLLDMPMEKISHFSNFADLIKKIEKELALNKVWEGEFVARNNLNKVYIIPNLLKIFIKFSYRSITINGRY